MRNKQKNNSASIQHMVMEVFLQPWFVPRETAETIRSLLPAIHFRKMRFYFDDWGCMKCEKKGVMYGANGMCSRCAQKVQHRVKACLEKRSVAGEAGQPLMCSRVESAKWLLRDLLPRQPGKYE
jgi:hypothetical protein